MLAVPLPLQAAEVCTRPTGRSRRSRASASRSATASSSGCWGPTAPASRRSSRSPAGWCGRPSGAARIGGEPAGSPEAHRSLGYLAELFRFPDWLTADELLGMHQRLAGSDGGARERGALLEAVGLAEARDAARRRDVEGHAAAARDRAGDGRQPARAAARRADQRARPGRPAHGAPAARGPARARRVGAAELAPAVGGRAGLRPRGDHRARRAGGGRHAGRAEPPERGRGRDGRRHARVRARRPRRGARRSCATSWPPARRSTACACCARRSRTPTWRRSART